MKRKSHSQGTIYQLLNFKIKGWIEIGKLIPIQPVHCKINLQNREHLDYSISFQYHKMHPHYLLQYNRRYILLIQWCCPNMKLCMLRRPQF